MTDRARDSTFDARTLLSRARTDVRETNRRRIIRAVMVEPGTQVAIAKRTHLSQATVSATVTDLQKEGVFVVESGDGERGRRVRLGPVRGAAVGVEVDHGSLTVVTRPVASTDVETAATVEFGPDQAGRLWVGQAVRLIHETVRQIGLTTDHIVSIGVGIPAMIDPRTSRITQVSSSLGWNMNGDPRGEFKTHFPRLPVIVDNEVNMAAFGEYTHGVGRSGHETMLFVKASIGIGAGLIVGGLIHRGRHGIAGEIGHLTMELGGRVCRCGNRGCLETEIGGVRLLEEVQKGYRGYRIDTPNSLEGMIERAKSGDPVCRRVLEDAGRTLGLALARACNLFNPEIIVLGGELGTATDLLLDSIDHAMRLHALRGMFHPEFEPVRVVASELGRQAGSRGALSFALQVDQPMPA
jgi:predicted NBD/HSP70 family sugar kinase